MKNIAEVRALLKKKLKSAMFRSAASGQSTASFVRKTPFRSGPGRPPLASLVRVPCF